MAFSFKEDDFVAHNPPDNSNDTTAVTNTVHMQKACVYTSTQAFDAFCDSMYSLIVSNSDSLALPSEKVFKLALKGYASLIYKSAIQRPDVLTIIDYSLSANKKRLWVLDLANQTVLFHELVAHGRNSGVEYARSFSNQTESYKSSLGFFITGDIYTGKHDISLRLHGVEKTYNSKALDRGIVIHGADYVSTDFIKQNQRLGRSQGCPAVSQSVIASLSGCIKDGTCVFAYYPQKSYLKYSKIIHHSVPFQLP